MKKLHSFPSLIILNAYWIGLSFKWNALQPIVLPAILLNYVPDAQKNTYLGILSFIGLTLAAIIQPLSGALSDIWVSRWGRRRPLMVAGTLFEFIFLFILARMGGLVWIFIGYIGLQLASNIAHGPAQGLLPDRVAREHIGRASGLKTVMDMTSLVIASLAAGRLLDPVTRDPSLIVGLIMLGVAGFTAITVLGTPEEPATPTGQRHHADWQYFLSQFKINFNENASYWWLVSQRFLFLLGIYGLQAFAQYYFQDVLRVPNPVQQTGDLLAALTVSLVFLALSGGWLVDRFGARPILFAACGLAFTGMLLLRLAQTSIQLLLLGSLVGGGIGLFLTAGWALANQLAPEAESGKYLGLTNIATAGAGALARLEGPAIDLLNARWPGVWVGYTGLFLFGAICILASAVLLKRVKINP